MIPLFLSRYSFYCPLILIIHALLSATAIAQNGEDYFSFLGSESQKFPENRNNRNWDNRFSSPDFLDVQTMLVHDNGLLLGGSTFGLENGVVSWDGFQFNSLGTDRIEGSVNTMVSLGDDIIIPGDSSVVVDCVS